MTSQALAWLVQLARSILRVLLAVAFLVELAHAGPALELAIGTGRLALPLAERGVEVHGIDASEAMVARLRSKSGGERIPVTIGDFADVPIEGRYALVYVVFNTLFALQTHDQVWLGAARHHPVEQRVESQHVLLSEQGIRFYPVQIRYAYPSELDLMARLAGLQLRARFGGWRREPFTAASAMHVSVYERADPTKPL